LGGTAEMKCDDLALGGGGSSLMETAVYPPCAAGRLALNFLYMRTTITHKTIQTMKSAETSARMLIIRSLSSELLFPVVDVEVVVEIAVVEL